MLPTGLGPYLMYSFTLEIHLLWLVRNGDSFKTVTKKKNYLIDKYLIAKLMNTIKCFALCCLHLGLKLFQSTPARSGSRAVASASCFSSYLFCQEVFDELSLNSDKPYISGELSVGLLFSFFLAHYWRRNQIFNYSPDPVLVGLQTPQPGVHSTGSRRSVKCP